MIANSNSSPIRRGALPSWERLAAAVIDFVVLFVVELIVAIPIAGHQYSRIAAFARAHENSSGLAKNPHFVALARQLSLQTFHVWIAAAAITAVYLIGMYLATGATLGKLALGLRITRTDGRPMTVRDAVLRSIVFWIGSPLLPLIGIWIWLLQFVGGTLVLLIRPDHRGPEDLLGGTMVVRQADRGRSIAELTGYGPPAVPPAYPPDAPPLRGGHLPGWGPVVDQAPPQPGGGTEEGPK